MLLGWVFLPVYVASGVNLFKIEFSSIENYIYINDTAQT